MGEKPGGIVVIPETQGNTFKGEHGMETMPEEPPFRNPPHCWSESLPGIGS